VAASWPPGWEFRDPWQRFQRMRKRYGRPEGLSRQCPWA